MDGKMDGKMMEHGWKIHRIIMMIVWIMLRILRSRSMIDLGHGCIIVYNVKIVRFTL